ncbi:hypothetical protein KHA94_16440 [Bacillus sp. FJAT-49705]|uniref:Uncharacterized protein n=1 Tax=Cytobacillus citreus TaxID=2833586 RepID=A0ABS5NVC9_9BACI|nr:hypothetical protein [Cytobacillus citreus]MBS4191780.1 hypothetical protein [Cytobacillus citreus]
MLYSVDFSVRVNNIFSTIHTAFIPAISVSECMHLAEEMKANLTENNKQQIYIFIAA